MRASKYQQYLGLPPDVVSPDYYQLLGIERGFIDSMGIDTTIHERHAHLEKADDRGAAAFLRRELEEAKATLMDPNRRSAYDELLERDRLGQLKHLVPAMIENGKLSVAAERAIIGHVAATGLEEHRIAAAIGERLRESGAFRGPREDPAPEALRASIAQMNVALRQIADQQFDAAMKAAGVESRPVTRRAMAAPKNETRMKPPSATQPAVRKETARRAAAPAAPPPIADTPESRFAVQMTEANERVSDLEQTTTLQTQQLARIEPEMARMRRRVRRIGRSLGSALTAALAFIAGHLLRVAPGLSEKIDRVTADTRESIVAAQSSVTIGLVAGGAALVLYGFIVIASGFKGKVWFLIPAILLALAALGAGAALMR